MDFDDYRETAERIDGEFIMNGIIFEKIKNGSQLFIGNENRRCNLMVGQHFNWFQKLMWKWCFGVKIKDYSEE